MGSNPTVSASPAERWVRRDRAIMNEFGNSFLINALIGFALALLISFAYVWFG